MDYLGFCRWDSGCMRKIRFSRAAHARIRIRRILRSGRVFDGDSLVPYRCRYCMGFHIGHARCNQQVNSQGREQL
jgi:hypothetical protein